MGPAPSGPARYSTWHRRRRREAPGVKACSTTSRAAAMGANPEAPLVIDVSGNLYGTA